MSERACPICKGTGSLPTPAHQEIDKAKANVARLLKKEGYSIRQIMRFLNYKSPRSVSILLKKK